MAQQGIGDPMQREAIRRMQEMHSRATRQSNSNSSPSTNITDSSVSDSTSPEDPLPITPSPPSSTASDSSTDLPLGLQELFDDRDKGLVLIVMLLLLGEHSDTSLIMTLVYLIL